MQLETQRIYKSLAATKADATAKKPLYHLLTAATLINDSKQTGSAAAPVRVHSTPMQLRSAMMAATATGERSTMYHGLICMPVCGKAYMLQADGLASSLAAVVLSEL
jgi:hypothetical protein